MKVLWIIYTDTKYEKNAQVILNKISKKLSIIIEFEKFEKYHKDNTQIIYFHSEHNFDKWAEGIYDVLITAQTIGRDWKLFGDIRNQMEGLSNDSNISGVVQIQFFID